MQWNLSIDKIIGLTPPLKAPVSKDILFYLTNVPIIFIDFYKWLIIEKSMFQNRQFYFFFHNALVLCILSIT